MALITLVCHVVILMARLVESSPAETGVEKTLAEMKDLMIGLRNEVDQLNAKVTYQESKLAKLEEKSSTVTREVSTPDDGKTKRGETSTKASSKPYRWSFPLCQRGRQGEPGRDGRDGRDGPAGKDGLTAEQLEMVLDKVLNNSKSEKLITISRDKAGYGAVYVRWGRTVCPKHSHLLYDGYAAGPHYTHKGGGSTKICLPREPQFDQTKTWFQSGGYIYGTEYEVNVYNPFKSTNTRGHSLHDGDVVCAVCLAKDRPSHVMIPARKTCPWGWTKEYSGYLMSEAYNHYRSSYDCVDGAPEVRDGGRANHNGALFYVVESSCGGALPCPPYKEGGELTCVVCTR